MLIKGIGLYNRNYYCGVCIRLVCIDETFVHCPDVIMHSLFFNKSNLINT